METILLTGTAIKISVQKAVSVAKMDRVIPVMLKTEPTSVTVMQEIIPISTMEFSRHVINCL